MPEHLSFFITNTYIIIYTQNASIFGLKERRLSISSSSQSDVDHSDDLEEEQKTDVEEPQPKKEESFKRYLCCEYSDTWK